MPIEDETFFVWRGSKSAKTQIPIIVPKATKSLRRVLELVPNFHLTQESLHQT